MISSFPSSGPVTEGIINWHLVSVLHCVSQFCPLLILCVGHADVLSRKFVAGFGCTCVVLLITVAPPIFYSAKGRKITREDQDKVNKTRKSASFRASCASLADSS